MSAIAFLAAFGVLVLAVATLSHWVFSDLDPYAGNGAFDPARPDRPAMAKPVSRRPTVTAAGVRKHNIEIRELPFLC